MTKRKPNVYVHKDTGDIKIVTKSEAKHLSPEYEKVEFTKNEDGKPVMRLKLNGATVDISENEVQEVAPDGNGHTE